MPKSKKTIALSDADRIAINSINKKVSGEVKSIAITQSDGLVFELKGRASRNKSYQVDINAPHYSGSVAFLMMAYTQNETVTVNHISVSNKIPGPIVAGAQTVYQALAVGLGEDPEV